MTPIKEDSVKVSALIPTYNRRKYVFRAIDSVLSQTVPVDEVIVVDDGSTDGTADAITARYDGKVRVVRQQNTGVSGARLRAIMEARGEWIAFLDSDDEWLPGRQSELLAVAEKLPPEVAWLFGDMRVLTDEGEGMTFFEKRGLVLTGHPQIFEDSLKVVYPTQIAWFQGSLIRRNVLLETGCFEVGFHSHEDFLAGVQVACKYKFAGIPSIVTKCYRTSDLFASSITINGWNTPDHYRFLMIAVPLLMKKTGKRDPWAEYYAGAVRGLCKLRAAQGQSIRSLVMEQFRYGTSFKSVVFFCAAAFGGPGLYLWEQSATMAKQFTKESRRRPILS